MYIDVIENKSLEESGTAVKLPKVPDFDVLTSEYEPRFFGIIAAIRAGILWRLLQSMMCLIPIGDIISDLISFGVYAFQEETWWSTFCWLIIHLNFRFSFLFGILHPQPTLRRIVAMYTPVLTIYHWNLILRVDQRVTIRESEVKEDISVDELTSDEDSELSLKQIDELQLNNYSELSQTQIKVETLFEEEQNLQQSSIQIMSKLRGALYSSGSIQEVLAAKLKHFYDWNFQSSLC